MRDLNDVCVERFGKQPLLVQGVGLYAFSRSITVSRYYTTYEWHMKVFVCGRINGNAIEASLGELVGWYLPLGG